ncbi:peptide ABC transporter substrate-binding protein [Clostridium sp. D2Q-11]|uniref:Peptide ABC transporter substrate-binding protein n=1 Tax=Anaeromonas frigoriresistens TaxID=2683708 RepID=A0A942UQ88_9FIRM|nr:peptide ABC transporter substrate-binding protein [Anaeromonas frigoriresistens]MBS4537198.1 peptide ABC transporter substrate-binding protein [Anaeromonas frigoriresistens]
MRGLRIKALIILLIMSIATIGCVDSNLSGDNNGKTNEEEKNYEPEYGGEIAIPISPIDTINPLLNKNESLYNFYNLVYEGLFTFNESHDVENVLVDSYKIENEGRTINIKLKDNVKWHDGENLTASDVKFTIDVLKYAARNSLYRDILNQYYNSIRPENIEHILSLKIVDEKNITIDFDRSYSNALESLTFPILPEHQFTNDAGESSYKEILDQKDDYTPIGTGPYKFVKYEKQKFIELESNDNWWREKPYIDTVIGKILEEDVELTSFNARNVDLARVSGRDWEKYADNKNTKIYEYVTNNYEFLGFNFRNKIFQEKEGKTLRKAIAYGINTKNIIEKNYMGHATESDLPLLHESWLRNEDETKYQYNPDKSKDLLKKAGFVDSDKDGILETPSGEKLEFNLLTNSYNSLRTDTADMIIEDLKKIGISVIPDYSNKDEDKASNEQIESDWETVISKTRSGKFDMVLIGWGLSEIPDLSFAFHSQKINDGTNFIAYNNPKMDELLVSAFNAEDREAKKEKYSEIQNILLEDLPYVGLLFRNDALLIDNRVKGDINPREYDLYTDVYKWFIPKELQNDPSNENDGTEEQE